MKCNVRVFKDTLYAHNTKHSAVVLMYKPLKTQIVDKDALARISRIDAISYLKSLQWVKCGEYRNASLWNRHDDEVLIPTDSTVVDYASLMATALEQLSHIEERHEYAIYTDIIQTGYDVIRIRNASEDTASGTLGIAKSADFLVCAKEMVLAAACSAATPKGLYQGRKPNSAEQFLESVRFGQTEYGSFIITLLAPVSPTLQGVRQMSLFGEEVTPDVPYEKTVIPMLESGLNAMNHAAKESSESGSVEVFLSNIRQGVSANLCEAVSGLYDTVGEGRVDVSITYSRNRAFPMRHCSIHIQREYMPYIKEAARAIKTVEPENEQTIRGKIVELKSYDICDRGRVTINDIFANKPRLINVELDGKEYLTALQAHRDEELVEIQGTVLKNSSIYSLADQSLLKVIASTSL